MAHLTCLLHGKRSVVFRTDYGTVVVRHRTNHDSACGSTALSIRGKVLTKDEVILSYHNHGVRQFVADLEALTKAANANKALESAKDRLKNKMASRPLARVGRRSKR